LLPNVNYVRNIGTNCNQLKYNFYLSVERETEREQRETEEEGER